MAKRTRPKGAACEIPNKLLKRFPTSDLGCMRIAFSADGKYLAAACTQKNSKTVIKIFDTEYLRQTYVFHGHRNIIHDLKWLNIPLKDTHYLISASSDFTAKVKISKIQLIFSDLAN